MKQKQTYKIAQLSILTALTILLGYFFKIPTATGILTLLDVGIFFTAFYLGSKEGAVVGGLGAFLLDLISGYPQWMFFSLIFHGGQGYLAGLKSPYRLAGLCLASLVMVGGYALASSFMNGWGAAVAEILPNFLQNTLGMIVAAVLANLLADVKEKEVKKA